MSRLSNYTIATILCLLAGISSLGAQKVFMTGDSHVFAKVYPATTEKILRTQHPDMKFGWWAKNGICFYSFRTNPEFYDSIFAFQPDILLVHLGTNGAYANKFTRREFRKEMETFYATLTDTFPEIQVVFVTPFTNKKRKFRKKGKWRVNYKNRDVADEIIAFVKDHTRTFVIDNNAQAGMKYLKSKTLIRPDNVHLTEAGYEDLGTTVANSIIGLPELWTNIHSPKSVEVASTNDYIFSPE